MGLLANLLLTLLATIIVSSTLGMYFISRNTSSSNGKCSDRDGICISSDICNKYNGQNFTGKCPSDPNDIVCCDNIPCKADDGRTGKCLFADQCRGEAISGKCPGGSDFKCCIQSEIDVPCSFEGLDGTCKNFNNCTGFTVSGKCSGGNDIKCCLPKDTCNDGQGIDGVCIPTDQCTTGNTISSKCPGSSKIKCCLSTTTSVITTDNPDNEKTPDPTTPIIATDNPINENTPKTTTPVIPTDNADKENIPKTTTPVIPTDNADKKKPHFTINELIKSDKAKEKNIDNTPSEEIKKKLLILIDNCLEPIREIFGGPIIVSSGYRCEKLNKEVGGASDSQHMKGEAADLQPQSGSLKSLCKAIIDFGDYDQFIIERPRNKTWAHVSYKGVNNRHEILYYDGKKYYPLTINNYEKYAN